MAIARYITILSCSALLSSCEKQINVKTPAFQPTLTVYSHTAMDTFITAQIGRSVDVKKYNGSQDLAIRNASLSLYKDGQLLQVMHYNDTAQCYTSTVLPAPGSNYKIVASAQDYTTIEGECTTPSIVPINDVIITPNVRINKDGNTLDQVDINFTDPASANDYYIISLISGADVLYGQQDNGSFTCVSTNDPSVDEYNADIFSSDNCLPSNDIVVQDGYFNGNTKRLTLFVQSGSLAPYIGIANDTGYAEVKMYHVTEAYIKYKKTSQYASDNRGNPFAEPTNVYNNIKNGYGIFSTASFSTKVIKY